VHERAALHHREGSLVDRLGVLLLAHDRAAARTAQHLVRGEGDDVGVRHGAGDRLARDQADEVRGVDHEDRAHLVGDLAEQREVDQPRDGGAATDDHLRPVLPREVTHLVIVDVLGLGVHAVLDGVEPLAAERHLRPVGQVPAVRQRHREQRVAGLHEGAVGGQVRVGAGVRLQVGVVSGEELLGPGDAEFLGAVHDLAAAVVAPARVALGVLVGQRAAQRGQHGGAGEVLAGDQLQAAAETVQLVEDDAGDLGVERGQGVEVRAPVGGAHLRRTPDDSVRAPAMPGLGRRGDRPTVSPSPAAECQHAGFLRCRTPLSR
jgi:hypothetical protein